MPEIRVDLGKIDLSKLSDKEIERIAQSLASAVPQAKSLAGQKLNIRLKSTPNHDPWEKSWDRSCG